MSHSARIELSMAPYLIGEEHRCIHPLQSHPNCQTFHYAWATEHHGSERQEVDSFCSRAPPPNSTLNIRPRGIEGNVCSYRPLSYYRSRSTPQCTAALTTFATTSGGALDGTRTGTT
jgi:hypothetical protein